MALVSWKWLAQFGALYRSSTHPFPTLHLLAPQFVCLQAFPTVLFQNAFQQHLDTNNDATLHVRVERTY
jgi:hypothetical protein